MVPATWDAASSALQTTQTFDTIHIDKMLMLLTDRRMVDRFLVYYSVERSHQGYRLKGRTPAQALMGALGVEEIPPVVPEAMIDDETELREAA